MVTGILSAARRHIQPRPARHWRSLSSPALFTNSHKMSDAERSARLPITTDFPALRLRYFHAFWQSPASWGYMPFIALIHCIWRRER